MHYYNAINISTFGAKRRILAFQRFRVYVAAPARIPGKFGRTHFTKNQTHRKTKFGQIQGLGSSKLLIKEVASILIRNFYNRNFLHPKN